MEGKHTTDEYIYPDDNFQPRTGPDWAAIGVYCCYVILLLAILRICW